MAGERAHLLRILGTAFGIAVVGGTIAQGIMRTPGLVAHGLLAALLPLACLAIQLLGSKNGGRSQEVGSAIKALIFAGLILALLFVPRATPVVPPAHDAGFTAIGVIVALRAIVGAYNGRNSAAYFVEELKDPHRALVRGTFSGIAAIALIYVLMNVALLRAMTPAEMAGSTLVAADAAARIFGTAPGAAEMLVTIVSLISLVTITNVLVMQTPRILFVITRDAEVPVLSAVVANGTPRAAVVVTVGLAALMATIAIVSIAIEASRRKAVQLR